MNTYDALTGSIRHRFALYGATLCWLISGLITIWAAAPAPWDRSAPALASNGKITLAVWQEKNAPDYDIHGARLDETGKVLDHLIFASATGDQANPAVACNGTDFLVVWADQRSGTGADIYGARITAGGVVLDPQGIAICTAPLNQQQPAVASDGANYLVVWQDSRNQSSVNIFGARISSAGVVLDSSGIDISQQGATSELNPSVAGASGGFMVVWQDARNGGFDIYGNWVASGGNVAYPSGFAISTAAGDQINPAITGNGTDFLAVWQDFRSGSNFDIYGTIITRAGIVRTPAGTAICAAARDQFNPVATSFGGAFFAAWTDIRAGTNNLIYGSRISSAGAAQDSSGILIGGTVGEHYHPALSGFNTGYWVAWHGYRPGMGVDVLGLRLNSAGTAMDAAGFPLGSGSGTSTQPQTPRITWATPADILYGTALGGSQLNATANTAGTFQYSPAAGTVLKAGNAQSLTVTFTPTDTQNYKTVSATIAINVQKANLTIRADNKTKQTGQPNPSLTATYTGFVNGDTVASLTAPASLDTTATAASTAGTYPIVASGAASPNYNFTYIQGTLTVSSAITLSKLMVQPSSGSVEAGQTLQFSATAAYSDGSTAVVTSTAKWQSSQVSAATVNGTGLSTGVAAGNVQITASFGGLTATATLAVLPKPASVSKTFANSREIEFHSGEKASVYPSLINVSGMAGKIDKATLTLKQLSVSSAKATRLLLVGPAGQKVLLMAGAGGSQSVNSINLTLDDLAPAALPKENRLTSGSYKPANYVSSAAFRSPAPSGPYQATLSTFKNTDPNGNWQLFIMASGEDQEGALHGGWSLAITTVSGAK